MIRIKRLAKSYGASTALVDVDLDVACGDGVGLSGPNGSGRSTLLRVVATLVRPTSGSVEIDGLDVVRHAYKLRPRIVYVGSESVTLDPVRVADYVRLVLTARGTPASREIVDAAITRAGLDGQARCDSLSGGIRQRLVLGAALAARPDVLLLDDPLRALDEAGRSRFVEWMLEARDQGTAMLMATQADDDIAATCARVARFDRGRITGVSTVTRSSATPRPAAARR